MSLKVSNVRVELDEPEAVLPEKLSARLGVSAAEIARWRILRKSLDARRHQDLHFVYAAEGIGLAAPQVVERSGSR